MPRIRTIKPEFWSSPSTAKASPVARLAFIAMWNWADDHGRGTANLKELEGFIFPNDDVAKLTSGNTAHFRDVVAEVVECFDVVFYLAGERPFYAILKWDEHQRNERRATNSKYPEPTGIPAFPNLVAEIPSQRTVDPNISVPGTGEQRNRGTGEVGTGEQGNSLARRASAPVVRDEAFELFWDAYGKKVGRGAAEKAWKKACKTADEEDITRAAALHADWHRRSGTEARFVPHASRWLNEKRWADERTDIEPPRRASGDIDWDAAMQRARARDERNAG